MKLRFALAASTAATLALAGWVYVGSTLPAEAWSWSSLFTGSSYNTPRTVIGHTMYSYDARTARWIGAYTDTRRTGYTTASRTYIDAYGKRATSLPTRSDFP